MSQRYDLTTIFTSRGNEWYELGDRPTQIEGVRTMSIPSAAGLSRELTSGGYDAIITSLSGRATLLATFGAAKFKRLPLVLWVEIWEHPKTLVHRLSRPVTHQLYRWADSIVAFGPHVADFVNGECGGRHDVFIATQAVDNQRFRTPIDPQRVATLRSRLELGDCPTVTFVGRLVPEKGVADLLAASAQVDHPHRVVIAGRGPMLGSLRDQAKFLGIVDRVRFIGHVAEPELLELLHASSLLVLPSRISRRWREPWGMVTNEAMNCAVPVIATDAVGAAAGGLVVQGETGLVIPQRDPRALAAGIRELIGDESKRRLLGQTAQARVLEWTHTSAADACEEAVASAVRRSGRAWVHR